MPEAYFAVLLLLARHFPVFVCFISIISFSPEAMSISIFAAKYPLQNESCP